MAGEFFCVKAQFPIPNVSRLPSARKPTNCNFAGMARGKFVTHRVYNRYTIGYRSVSLLLKIVVYSTGSYSAHAFPFGEGGPP